MSAMSSCLKKSRGNELSRLTLIVGTDFSADNSTVLGLRKSLLREPEDKDLLVPLNEGLLEEEVDRELALVEVLVLDLDRELDLGG